MQKRKKKKKERHCGGETTADARCIAAAEKTENREQILDAKMQRGKEEERSLPRRVASASGGAVTCCNNVNWR